MNELKDKQYKDYDKLSRYEPYPYYYDVTDKKYVYGTTGHLSTNTPYVAHTVKQGDTWDSLALYYYNNPTYYWIICDYNRVQNPFNNPKINEVVKIPTFSAIRFENI